MLKTTSDLSLLFHVLRAAISHEMPALNPAEVSAVVERWERPDGVVSAERICTAILLAAESFLDSIGELVGADKAGADSWLNSCSPLICGALHDIFEHCLAQRSRDQRVLTFDFLAGMSTFSKVLRMSQKQVKISVRPV
ncbi:TPA: hypothetical protein ACXI12_004784 [Pseudomonas aeruginosa]